MLTPRFSVGPDALSTSPQDFLAGFTRWSGEGMEEHGRNEQRRDKKIKGRKGRKTVI